MPPLEFLPFKTSLKEQYLSPDRYRVPRQAEPEQPRLLSALETTPFLVPREAICPLAKWIGVKNMLRNLSRLLIIKEPHL